MVGGERPNIWMKFRPGGLILTTADLNLTWQITTGLILYDYFYFSRHLLIELDPNLYTRQRARYGRDGEVAQKVIEGDNDTYQHMHLKLRWLKIRTIYFSLISCSKC